MCVWCAPFDFNSELKFDPLQDIYSKSGARTNSQSTFQNYFEHPLKQVYIYFNCNNCNN